MLNVKSNILKLTKTKQNKIMSKNASIYGFQLQNTLCQNGANIQHKGII